jgi:hypothetical protein
MSTYKTKLMPVSHEIKSQLAKLLATEDLVVEHKRVETACFNVHTRVLTLPLWDKASNTVYDLLVGHEVGHALFTPDDDWFENNTIPQQFVNIVEDARIEKLMKRKYAGLAKTFYNGYKELNDEDFFQIADEDLENLNLADKTNLYFKVGNFLSPLNFNSKEKEIVECIDSCETFTDVIIAAEKLYEYCKEEQQKQQKVANLDSHDSEQQGNSSSGEQTGETEESENDRQEPSQSKQPEESSGNSSGNQTIPDLSSQEPEVRTADALREKIESLVSSDNRDNVYVELPHLNLETIIAKNSEIHQYIDENFERQKKYIDANNDTIHNLNLYEEADKSYKQFKTSAQKEVNYLVKEFECRKAADSYARTSTARTGVLDTARLHTYKYNEDLFKKMSVIPDGKNHGLIFILDWSGSMNEVIQDTCKQLFNLIWFCKKVSIPFEVYAFTNEWRSPSKSQEVYSPHYEKREGLIYVADDFSLLNLLTSKVNMKTLEHQMLNIWRLTIALRNPYGCGCRYVAPTRLYLSSTPLNEALIALHQILPNFQRENKLQKVQCVVLTDGEANCLPYHIEVKRGSEPYIGVRGISPGQTFLRDRKIGTTYKFGHEYHKFTEVLISNLKDKFPTVNMIGIRVLQNRDTSNFVSLYYNKLSPQYGKILSDWKKNRSLNILDSSYDAYFGLSASTLSQDSEFEVAEDATKSQIKSAFVKSLKIKKLNKKVLGQFMELVV